MKIIPIIIISFLIMSNSIAQNTLNTEKSDYYYIRSIKSAYSQHKNDKTKKLSFFKSMHRRKKILSGQYRVATQLVDTVNQRVIVEIRRKNIQISMPGNEADNILALFDTERDSVISILGSGALLGFYNIKYTADYIIAAQAGSSLYAWNRITGELHGLVHHGSVLDVEVRENSNQVLVTFCGRGDRCSMWGDIENRKNE